MRYNSNGRGDDAVERFKERRAERLKRNQEERYDAVEEYRKRRNYRLRKRMDADDDVQWITVNGAHIPVDENRNLKGKVGKQIKNHGNGGSRKNNTSKNRQNNGNQNNGASRNMPPAEINNAKSVGGYDRKHVSGEYKFVNGYHSTSSADRNDEDSGITIKQNTNENGEWTEEREALHSKIIDNAFTTKGGKPIKKAAGKPVCTFMGGGPGSGKSYVRENQADNLKLPRDDESVTVDPDEIKKSLPEYDPKNPSPVHEESSALGKRITELAWENGYNTLIDGTGDGSVKKMREKIQQARDAGCTVNGVYVFTDIENAIVQNYARDRTVKDRIVLDTHMKLPKIVPEIAKDFDHIQLYSNMMDGTPPKLIAEGGGGKGLTIYDEGMYQRFLDTADYKIDPDRIKKLAARGRQRKYRKNKKKNSQKNG